MDKILLQPKMFLVYSWDVVRTCTTGIYLFRYVCWSAYLLKKHPKLESKLGAMTGEDLSAMDYTAKLPLDQKVYFQYYVQDDTDDGVLMNTKIKIKEVRIKTEKLQTNFRIT